MVQQPFPVGRDARLTLQRHVLDHLAQAGVAVVVDELPRRALAETLGSHRPGHVGRHENEPLRLVPLAEAAGAEGAAVSDGLEQPLGAGVALVLHVQLAIGDEDADGTLVAPESPLHVKRVPRTHGLVLGQAVHELARRANGVHVHVAGIPLADVAQAQGESAADGDVDLVVAPGPDAGTGVETDFLGDGTVDHENGRVRRSGHQQRLAAVRANLGQRLDRCDNHRHVLRQGACHGGVDSYFLHRRKPETRGHVAHQMVRRQRGALQQRIDRLARRRVHGQAVAPVAAQEVLVHAQDGGIPVIGVVGVTPLAIMNVGSVPGLLPAADEGLHQAVDGQFRLPDTFVQGKITVDAGHGNELQVRHGKGA